MEGLDVDAMRQGQLAEAPMQAIEGDCVRRDGVVSRCGVGVSFVDEDEGRVGERAVEGGEGCGVEVDVVCEG